MKFFITSLFFLFTSLGFSQENLKHTVQKGETLFSISKKYNVSVSTLEKLNPSAKKGLSVNFILQISANNRADVGVEEHKVVAKETLFGLSKKYNVSIEKLRELNPSIESEGLKIGTVLRLSNSENYSIPEKVIVEKPKQNLVKKGNKGELQEVFHTVLPKETKYGLSKKYGVSISELEKLNPEIVRELPVGFQLLSWNSKRTWSTLNEREG